MNRSADSVISIRTAVGIDFRESSWRYRFALIGVAFWVAYEWGIGNETVTPLILVRVIATTSGWAVIPVTAAVGFSFTVVQQLISGFTALYGFSIFDRTSRSAWSRLQERFGSIPGEWTTLGLGARSLIVFTLGTTVVALVQVMSTGEIGVRRHARAIVQSALLCGVLVGLLGGVAAAMAEVGRRVEPLAGPTDWVLRVLGNPLFWLAILLGALLVHLVRQQFPPSPTVRRSHSETDH